MAAARCCLAPATADLVRPLLPRGTGVAFPVAVGGFRCAAAASTAKCVKGWPGPRVPADGCAPRRRAASGVTARASKESAPDTTTEMEVSDRRILQYCDIDKKKDKRSIGEMEQDFLDALRSYYFDEEPMMSNEEFDNLKEELMWNGSGVVMLSTEEMKFMEASLAYHAGKSIMSDEEYDSLKRRLKKASSRVAVEGPRCSLRSRQVVSDLQLDYLRMTLLQVPAVIATLTLVFFLDDLTGFELTYLLELPEPYSFLFTWFIVLPFTYFVASRLTNYLVKDFLILTGPCPECSHENRSFFGTILTIKNDQTVNDVKCEKCGTALKFDADTRRITINPDPSPPPKLHKELKGSYGVGNPGHKVIQ
eukprot:SM000073S21431  [mRNA]  locus=s73:258936:261961:+ [translate_table: standard]